MRKFLLSIMVIAAVATGGSASGASTSNASYCKAVRHDINKARVDHGEHALADNPKLDASATFWAKKHPKTNGKHWVARIRSFGVSAPDLGETLAWNFSDPHSVVPAWLASPDHRGIVLAGYSFFQFVGVGCSSGFVVADFSGK